MNVTFLGAGAFGTALADIATENGHAVNFYDPYKYPEITLQSALENSDAIIFVTPSHTATKLTRQLPQDLPLICASKGFLSAQSFQNFLDFGALGGAAFAADYHSHTSRVADKITLTTSSDLAEHIFAANWLKIEYTPDTTGILLCGALKNIYALGAGLLGTEPVDLAAFKTNPEQYLASHPYLQTAGAEIRTLLAANGAQPDTFNLSCGLPDLALTCTPASRNFTYGRQISALETAKRPETAPGQKPAPDATTEGLAALRTLRVTPDFIIPDTARLLRAIIQHTEPLL